MLCVLDLSCYDWFSSDNSVGIMKINGGISTGNIIVMATMLVSIVLAYSKLSTTVDMINGELDKKAEKDVVEVHFIYIQQQLNEIKTLIKEK